MPDVLRVLIVFGAILALLRMKWGVGYVLLVASAILWLLYLMPPDLIVSTVAATLTDPVTIKLFFALTLIRVLELLLREHQVLSAMTEASRSILKRKKAVIVSMPMLIGLLPSLGGAYFSAPMVDASTKGLRMTQEEKGFINYWYRHPWEYVLPLYPGIVLVSALTGFPLRSVILANLPCALVTVISGFVLSMRNVKGTFAEVPQSGPDVKRPAESGIEQRAAGTDGSGRKALWSFAPLVFVLALVIPLRVELHYALGLTIAGLFLFYRTSPKDILRSFRYGFARDVIILILGVMLFKFSMDNSGAVAGLSRYFTEREIPLLPTLLVLPFVSGLLTGITVGFVGGTFPVLLSIAGGTHLNEVTLAFASGFVGVLLSPVHLCLVLTREYFKADVWGIYRKVIPGCCGVMATAVALYFVL
jgi:hypothetical protein